MYEFQSPFYVDGSFIKEIMQNVLQDWVSVSAKIENDFGSFDIWFQPESLNDKASYRYSLIVNSDYVTHQIRTTENTGTLSIQFKSNPMIEKDTLKRVLNKFGVIDYGFIEASTEVETKRVIKKALEKTNLLRTYEDMLIDTTDYKNIIKWHSSSDGFYYTFSHWDYNVIEHAYMDVLMVPEANQTSLSKRFVQQLDHVRKSENMIA